MINFEGQEVKAQGYRRPKLDLGRVQQLTVELGRPILDRSAVGKLSSL